MEMVEPPPCNRPILKSQWLLDSGNTLLNTTLLHQPNWKLAITFANIITTVLQFLSLSLYQWTPLHMAVKDGNEHTLKFIVDSGAAIDIKDDSGVSDTLILTSPAVLIVS